MSKKWGGKGGAKGVDRKNMGLGNSDGDRVKDREALPKERVEDFEEDVDYGRNEEGGKSMEEEMEEEKKDRDEVEPLFNTGGGRGSIRGGLHPLGSFPDIVKRWK